MIRPGIELTSGREQPTNATIVGVGLVLFAAVLIGFGLHHLIRTGTCSSTGYSANFGPVPHCPSGTAAWIGFLVGGIFIVFVGGFLSSAALIIPALFCAIGVGAISVAFDSSASSGSTTFGLIFGICFLLVGLVPAVIVVRRGLRRSLGGARPAAARPPRRAETPAAEGGGAPAAFGQAEQPDAILGTYQAGRQAPDPRSDPGP